MSDRLTVKAQVDETDIAEIHLKQRAEIVLDAYPDRAIPARVDQIAYEAKTVNNVTTYIVDVLPDKTPSFMRSGMTANVTFLTADKKGVLLVPAQRASDQGGPLRGPPAAGEAQGEAGGKGGQTGRHGREKHGSDVRAVGGGDGSGFRTLKSTHRRTKAAAHQPVLSLWRRPLDRR